jgi:ribonucleoside-diphosphate reductase alpha chain
MEETKMNQKERVMQRIYTEGESKPEDVFKRVADYLGKDKNEKKDFFNLMNNNYFLPNSPCLVNAGIKDGLGQLNACFVLPIYDSMHSIFETLQNTALIHKTGGGTGFNFSNIRPRGSSIKTTGGEASGVVSFMKVYDVATEQIKQGGVRRGANMAILNIDHPDIFDFLSCKRNENAINNFNISVGIKDSFMKAYFQDADYDLVYNSKVYKTVKARDLFKQIVDSMHRNGEPGVVFLDTINREYKRTTFSNEIIDATNPCGEAPLLPFESCCLGSINLSQLIEENNYRFDQVFVENLIDVIKEGVIFLNRMLEKNNYPLKENRDITMLNRKIGLGYMGFADMLIKMGIVYGSSESVNVALKLSQILDYVSKMQSKKMKFNNVITNAIAPTGTISIIAGCSSSIEPLFSIKEVIQRMDTTFTNTPPIVDWYANKHNVSIDSLFDNKLFRLANDISWQEHLKIQYGFQKHIDNGVSKTINLPSTASLKDVENIFFSAYSLNLKGFTVYRDQSRSSQVISKEVKCNKCGQVLIDRGGCNLCPNCGGSSCG